ncbi:MAG: ABC-2 transporter permease [Lachnospiraceae bacterium]|nr:ABC-2 transporter permease [Lachnospiraceae bacterium]
MKGILIKDVYCLKRKLFYWGITVFMAGAVCLMFVISSKHGNLAKFFAEWENTEDPESAADAVFMIPFLCKWVLSIFLLLPLAAAFDLVQSVFTDDENASFYKVAASLPVSRFERVGARATLIAAALSSGIVIDMILLAFCVPATDLLTYREAMEVVMAFAGVALLCQSVALWFGYRFGAKAAMYGNLLTLAGLAVLTVLGNLKLLKRTFTAPDELKSGYLYDLFDKAVSFLENKGHFVLLIAVPVFAVCYFAACSAAVRKRGVA